MLHQRHGLSLTLWTYFGVTRIRTPFRDMVGFLVVVGSDQLIDEQGSLKESAAEALSALGALGQPQASSAPAGGPSGLPFPLSKQQSPVHSQQALALLSLAEPGPSSHPNGPPNLGQLSALAAAAGGSAPVPDSQTRSSDVKSANAGDAPKSAESSPSAPPATRTRGARSANMGSDEWARQRKDNHKEVERRRRGNINEGINELGRIVPNGSGEKAKGAILSRAVQYIHHLKENEARNIEKWTLEKLLMDQAMGDLQAQLEEMRRLWEEERAARTRAESELDVLRGLKGSSGTSAADGHAVSASAGAAAEKASEASAPAAAAAAATSASDGETTQGGEEENSRPGKRQRTD
ncbi:hypothetical protein DFH94DRAFT_779949 [Russula ochroleuca]|uniref:BHLH domain-containing protein n=1 Tax=Russula ochroleuca TaxID=152965 RepID=A0A9P5JWV1_9AGAM|nr:hypothetical protein DFH94DRAFT_779949 [Russula ochroleuca]